MKKEVFIIAEIAQAHEGSLGIAHSYIEALATVGVNAVKFQTHIAEAESSSYEKFRVNFTYEDQTRYDYWKRMEFTPEQWEGLKKHCEDKNVEFISSPFSNRAVDVLEQLGVKRYKIGSGEANNLLLLKKIGKTGKPIILSSGMSSLEELDKSIDFLKTYGNKLSLLQCTTAYPTQAVDWGLNVISLFKKRYALPVGFSDHSGDIFACIAAIALGAEILEFHAVFDKQMFGPDAPASMNIAQIKQLVQGVHQINTSLAQPVDKNDNSRFAELKGIFEKTLSVNRKVAAGEVIAEDMLEAKKPRNMGINADLFESVIGRKAKRDLQQWDFLTEEDLYE